MPIGTGFGWTRGVARFCTGLWDYLRARVDGRTKVELEKERNLGTTDAIRALPPGAELLENEPGGRFRFIRKPHPSAPLAPLALPPGILPQVIEQPAHERIDLKDDASNEG